VLHVGTPKTGTSFVQELLFQNRDRLAERGVLYPADRFDAHFLAALDLLELPWGGLEQQAVGAWERLAEQVRAWEGTVIISHEILATASREHVRRALDSFGAVGGVDVVVSVRDLVRQIPAEWQENVKHRRTIGYHVFLHEIQDPESTGKLATWFWGVQDIPSILDRWGADLPPERVHVLTVPKPGAPRNLLWERFASVFGLVPEDFDTSTVDKANPSLGVAESALLLRINKLVNGVLPNEQYRELVRELLAHRTLSRRPEAVRLRLPDDVRAWAVGVAEEWIDELASRGYDVVGSLAELRPDPVEHETVFLTRTASCRNRSATRPSTAWRPCCYGRGRCAGRSMTCMAGSTWRSPSGTRRAGRRGWCCARSVPWLPAPTPTRRQRWASASTGRPGAGERSAGIHDGAADRARGPRLQLAGGVPTDLPGGVGVGAPAPHPADEGDPP